MQVAPRRHRLIEAQRRPHHRLAGIVEALGHYANHGSRATVQIQGLAQDLRVPAKALDPDAIAEDHHAIASGLYLFLREGAAQNRTHLQRLEESAVADGPHKPLRLVCDGCEGEGSLLVSSHAREDLILRAPVLVISGRGHHAGDVALLVRLPNIHQALGLRERQGTEQHCVEDTEDSTVGADPQRQGQDGREGESRILTQRADGESEIIEDSHPEAIFTH